MKKYFISAFIIALLVWGVGFATHAHENDMVNGVHLFELHTVLGVPAPTLLPDSPWYFVKNIGRGIRLFFTFDPAKKAELELQFADEKLAEMGKVLAKEPDQKGLERALQNYLDAQKRLRARLESLKGKNKNVDQLLEKLNDRVKKHEEIFEGLKDRVGMEAMEHAKKEMMRMDEQGKELMREKMKEMSPGENKMMEGMGQEKMMNKSTPESSAAVTIINFSFKNVETKIKVGAAIRWNNQDVASHTVTSDAGKFDSGSLSKDKIFEHTFSEKGVFPYHCSFHPSMHGKIIVE